MKLLIRCPWLTAGVLGLFVAGPLAARTIDLLDEDCERVAAISSNVPRLSWAVSEWPRGVYTTNLGISLRPGNAVLICFPIDQIPKGQRIRSAELTIPVWGAEGPGRITVRRILGDWGTGVCHQYRMTYPKKVEWGKPGARAIGSDCATKPTAVLQVNEKGHKTVNVFKDVEMWYNGDASNHGWIITAEDQNTSLQLMCPVSSYPAGRGVWKLSVEYVPEDK
jgi:hypothetical protein